MPTVCGLCPVGCNIAATTREGKVKRILSRNHPEVDEGWLCDKGRFAFTHLCAQRPDHRAAPPPAPERLRGDLVGRRARRGGAPAARGGRPVVVALSGAETVEQAYALGELVRRGSARTRRSCRRRRARRSTPSGAAVGDPRRRARGRPRRRARRRARARRRPLAAGRPPRRRRGRHHRPATRTRAAGACADAGTTSSAAALREARARDPVWSGEDGAGGAQSARWPQELGFGASPARARSTCPRRRTAAASPTPGPRPTTARASAPEQIGLLIVSGDEAARRPASRALAERAEHVLVTSMFPSERAAGPTSSSRATSYLERDGTTVNLEGRVQRLRRARDPALRRTSSPGSRSSPSASASSSRRTRRGLRGALGADLRRAAVRRGRRAGRSCAPRERSSRRPSCPSRRARAEGQGPLRPGPLPPLFSGPAVERVPELAVPAARARGRAVARGRGAPRDRDRRRRPRLARTARRSSSARGSTARLRAGVVRIAERARTSWAAASRWRRLTEPWWIALSRRS